MREKAWKIISTDVLIVGGGFGGLWAALRAAECGAQVLLADKSFAGRSGHSYFAGGAMVAMLPDDDPDACLEDIVQGNNWLVDQHMARAVLAGSHARLRDLEAFGLPFKKKNKQYVYTKARGTKNVKNFWPDHATAADTVILLRKVAMSRGVRFMDHLYVYGLTKDDAGGVCGAVGVNMRGGGEDILFQAKAVILATNSGGFRGHHLASDMQGTGPFMALEAGARLKNPEFHYINIRPSRHEIEGSGIMPAIGARWKNAKGEYYMEKYDPVLKDRAPVARIVASAVREHLKGNSPVGLDVESMTEEQRETFRQLQVSHGWMPVLFRKCAEEEGYDPIVDNIEWQPAYESNKLSIEADQECRASVPGLFAAGMARDLGINPFTGWSIASSTWSGYAAGESAAAYAAQHRAVRVLPVDADKSRERFYAPLAVKDGHDPDEVTYALQSIVFPAEVLIIMREENLKNALEAVRRLKTSAVPTLAAKDHRGLVKVKEVRTMVMSAEMSLAAALMRRETRENIFIRDDYPEEDNVNWLKWIMVDLGPDEGFRLSTKDIPFAGYSLRP